MGAVALLPHAVVWPQGVTHLSSGRVATLLGVAPRRVARWQTLGLITASEKTGGGHRRFTRDDVETFLRQATLVCRLRVRDIVSCLEWNHGQPVRVLHVATTHEGDVAVRWQDVSAHDPAVAVRTGHNRLVRRLHREPK